MKKCTDNSRPQGSMAVSRRQTDYSPTGCPCGTKNNGVVYDASEPSRARSEAYSLRQSEAFTYRPSEAYPLRPTEAYPFRPTETYSIRPTEAYSIQPKSDIFTQGRPTFANGSFESSFPQSRAGKDDELSRALAGATNGTAESPVDDEELFFIIEELNQQTCILKSRLAEMMAKHQKEKCNCPVEELCLQDNSPKNCVCKERTEDDRSRGGTIPSVRDPSMLVTPRECSFYRPCAPNGEICEQKIYISNMDDKSRQADWNSEVYSHQQRAPAGGAIDGCCRCDSRVVPQREPQNEGNKDYLSEDQRSKFGETATLQTGQSILQDVRSRGGVSRFQEVDEDNMDRIFVTKSFVGKMSQIQDDILGLKEDLKALTECKCVCADYNQAQFKKRVSEIEKTLSTISTAQPPISRNNTITSINTNKFK